MDGGGFMNDILFGNSNQKMINKLAFYRLKSSRQQNFFVIVAVLLTTVLFAAFFSAYGGFLNQVNQMNERMFGTRHAVIKFLTQEQYEKLKSSEYIKEISYTRLVGTAVNAELLKLNTEVRYAEDGAAESFLSYPTTGTMPQAENEIAVSTLVLDALNIPYQLGETVRLSIEIDGIIEEKEFLLCGFWEGYKLASAQEIWVSLAYANRVAPAAKQSLEESGRYAGLLCADIDFPHRWNLEKQLDTLLEEMADIGIKVLPAGINPAYRMFSFEELDFFFIFALFLLIAVVMFVGYLIIYNLFFISVTQDISFFGLLRAIGASGRQIKTMVRRQAMLLGLIGLPFGLLGGYLIGYLLLPFVITQTSIIDSGKYWISPIFLVAAAVFSLLTVYISSQRPCCYAAKISAAEAVSYTGIEEKIGKGIRNRKKFSIGTMAVENLKRNRKKAVLVILSLGFSIVLLDLTDTIVTGFDLNTYIEQNVIADFYLTDYSIQQAGMYQKNLSGVSRKVLNQIQKLLGLEDCSSIYAKNIVQKLPDTMGEWIQQNDPDHYGGALSEEYLCTSLVYGIEDSLLDRVELTKGTWDMELWKAGKGVIITDFYYSGNWRADHTSPLYQIGDILYLKDGEGQEREFQIMGIGELDRQLNAQMYYDLGIMIVMPDRCFQELYGETQPLCTIFNVEDSYIEDTEQWISEYCETVEDHLTYRSRKVYEEEFRQGQRAYGVIGSVLSLILALIGILNFTNMSATSIIIRQKELTLLCAVGMSEKQVKQMLLLESFFYIGLAFLWAVTVGKAVNYVICSNVIAPMWTFQYRMTWEAAFVMFLVLLGIAFVIPLGVYRNFKRKSIVERLRME